MNSFKATTMTKLTLFGNSVANSANDGNHNYHRNVLAIIIRVKIEDRGDEKGV